MLNPAQLVFAAICVVVIGLGWFAGRWRRADLGKIHEWGLGGSRFGTWMTWFLLGGDLYTAYTFIAVPALVFGAGAMGFFALPYCVIAFPLVFLVVAALRRAAETNGAVTAADLVLVRFGCRWLELATALTGLLATLPYLALQLVGLEVALSALGLDPGGRWHDLPLVIAFLVLSVFTWSSGLRAPALIAVVKDVLIYVTIGAAVLIIPQRLGGFAALFHAVPTAKLLLPEPKPHDLGQYSAFATLALGSAMALFLYPHAITGVLSASSTRVVKRNTALMPAYSVLLAFLALTGFMALAAGVDRLPQYAEGFREYGASYAVPALFLHMFPGWLAGVAFAAIAIGALVPASVMSIAAANLFARNVYKPLMRPAASSGEEAKAARTASLAVKFGALLFVLAIPHKYAIQFQLLGGVWILQILPAVVLGLYVRRLDPRAVLAGWVAGMAAGSLMLASTGLASAVFALRLGGWTVPGYAALYALAANLLVLFGVNALLAEKARQGRRTAMRAIAVETDERGPAVAGRKLQLEAREQRRGVR